MDTYLKLKLLKERLIELGSVVIGFSGGVDSTFLLKIAHDLLGENVIAITIKSCIHPEWEHMEALEMVKNQKIHSIVLNLDVLDDVQFINNPPERCYLCKKVVFSKIKEVAKQYGIHHVLDGTNFDDLKDYRPGMKASKEIGVISPLLECKLTKDDIRYLSKEMDLLTWDKPSFACLASRIPYGEIITKEKLIMIEKAEEILMGMGFRQVRVRHHGIIAKIELDPKERHKLFDEVLMDRIAQQLKDIGFQYVTLDLLGYRTGSLNESIQEGGNIKLGS